MTTKQTICGILAGIMLATSPVQGKTEEYEVIKAIFKRPQGTVQQKVSHHTATKMLIQDYCIYSGNFKGNGYEKMIQGLEELFKTYLTTVDRWNNDNGKIEPEEIEKIYNTFKNQTGHMAFVEMLNSYRINCKKIIEQYKGD